MANDRFIRDRRRNNLSPITGGFINPVQEADFRAGIRPVWIQRARTVILIALLALLLTSVIDYVLLGLTPAFYALLAARLVVTAQGLAYLWAVGRNRSLHVFDFGLLLFLVLLISAFLVAVALRPDGPRITAPAAILVLCVFYMVPMTRLWITVLAAGYLSFGMAAIGQAVNVMPTPPLVVTGIQLFTANLIGYFVCLRMHKDMRLAWVTQQTLERRERHQSLLAQLSSQFLGLPSNQLDSSITQVLKTVCEHADCDRAYVLEFDEGHSSASMTYEWCREDIPHAREKMQNIPASFMPWATMKMQRGEVVQVDRVSELPPEAVAERDLNRAQGVQSFLCVPLAHEGHLLGMIGLDCVRHECTWDEDSTALLRFVGQAVFNALQRSRAQASMRARESQFQTLTSLSPIGIFQTDKHGECLYFNERWTQLSGLSPELALGSRWQQALHADDAVRVLNAWKKAVVAGTEIEEEFRVRRPDDSVIWVRGRARPLLQADGQLQGFIGTVDDITGRKNAQIELEQRARLDQDINELTALFVQHTGMDIKTLAEQALARVAGFADADRCAYFSIDTQKSTLSCQHLWQRPEVQDQDLDLQGMPLIDYGWATPRILRGEIVSIPKLSALPGEAVGERKKLEATSVKSLLLVPILSAGQITSFMSLAAVQSESRWGSETTLLMRIAGEMILNAIQRRETIQSQHQHIRDLEAVNMELEKRNTDLQKLAYVTSHDLQEPLRAISGFSTMLKDQYRGKLDARADEYIGFVVEASSRLHRLINDLLGYSRVDHQLRAPVKCDLNEITQIVLANLAEPAQSLNARIECADLPTVRAEPLQMIQLMQHLVANALQFHSNAPPAIQISAERLNDEWVISVADNGIGIAPEHTKRVFEIFQRLNPGDHSGTGIGLPVCRRIVEHHGGRIWVEPHQPHGSIFRWTLPAALSVEAARTDESRHAA